MTVMPEMPRLMNKFQIVADDDRHLHHAPDKLTKVYRGLLA